MSAQAAVVAVVVLGCALYAAWTLMPRAARRRLAAALAKGTWPAPVERFLARHAQADAGCGCDGCDAGPARPKAPSAGDGAQPLTFHPRARR